MKWSEKTREDLNKLREDDLDHLLMIVRTRMMLEQREIDIYEVAQYLECSHRWIRMVLSGGEVSRESRQQWLDKVDDAIDGILSSRKEQHDSNPQDPRTTEGGRTSAAHQ